MDRSAFQHNAILDLRKESNSLEFDFRWSIGEVVVAIQGEPISNPTDPLPSEDETKKKMSIFYVSDMDLEKQGDRKKLKVNTWKDIIDLEQDQQ